MKRWLTPEKQAARNAILKRFYGFGNGPHYVYAVVARQNRSSRPIYVGETSRPKKRFEQHLAVAYGGREDNSRNGRLERKFIATGAVIEFHCLEECANRIEALAREAAWARALSSRGYNLGNSWAEHQAASETELVPLARLAALSLSEALTTGLQFGLSCTRCGTVLELSHESLQAMRLRNPKLDSLAKSIACPDCSVSYELALLPELEQNRMRRIDPASADTESFLRSIAAHPRGISD